MGTSIRPQLSVKNKYWIDKHRYYELRHFCLQYPDWKKNCLSLDSLSAKNNDLLLSTKGNGISKPTENAAEARAYYLNRIRIIEQAAKNADADLWPYILKAVTEDLSYNYLKLRLEMPCCKDTYYDRYHKFFYLLSKSRN